MAEISVSNYLKALQVKHSDTSAPICPWIIGGGGGLNGAFLAGVQVALVERGLQSGLTGVVGVSTSIPCLGHLLAATDNDAKRHWHLTTTYSVEARSRRFVKPLWRLDVPWLRGVFEGSTGKPIDYDGIVQSGIRFVGVLTDWESGRPHYVEPTSRSEFFTLIEAGCSVPGLAPPVRFRGQLMTDGMARDPCPISWLMSLPEAVRPTHILVVTNAWPTSRKEDVQRWKGMRLLFGRRAPRHIIDGFALGRRRLERQLRQAYQREDVAVAVEWLPWPQKALERNPAQIEALTRAGYERFQTLLEEGDR